MKNELQYVFKNEKLWFKGILQNIQNKRFAESVVFYESIKIKRVENVRIKWNKSRNFSNTEGW